MKINQKILNSLDLLILLFLLVYKIPYIIILPLLLYIIFNLYYKNSIKIFYNIIILSTVITVFSLLVGVQYKLIFNLILFTLLGYIFKKTWLNIIIIAIIISPSIYIHKNSFKNNSIGKSYYFNEYEGDNYDYKKWKNMNGKYDSNKLKNNISYYYIQCQLTNIFCNAIENINDEKSNTSSVYLENVINQKSYFDKYGNVYKIVRNTGIDSKKYIYDYSKAITKNDIKLKTIFIPFNQEEIVVYNYWLLKDYAFENTLKSKNKCKLLLYGTRNGWVEYKNQLIDSLKNDKNNECIFNLESYNFELDQNKLENDKKDMINVLSQLK